MKELNILLLISTFNFYLLNCHWCGSDLIQKQPGRQMIINHDNKRKLSNEYTPLKIKFDTSILMSQNVDNNFREKAIRMLNSVSISLSKLISVRHEVIDTQIIDSLKTYCEVSSIDSSVTSNWFNGYDLLIFPYVNESLPNNVLAAASPCYLSNTNRSIAGRILLNPNMDFNRLNDEVYMKNIFIHEITHILGFNPFFFSNLKFLKEKEVDGEIISYISSPKLIEKAKIHFGCDNIDGIPVENQGEAGTVGSHWETRYMLGEYMIGSDYSEVVISDITLAFLEDTGYYKVNYLTGGLFRFGKNQGCAFFKKKCLYNKGKSTLFPNEFCYNKGEAFCSTSRISKGNCYITKYNNPIEEKYRYFQDEKVGGLESADYCPISFANKNEDYYYPENCKYGRFEYSGEKIGDNSICFLSTISLLKKESICYEIECNKKNNNFKVKIGNTEVTCPGTETVLTNPSGLSGNLECPSYDLVCSSSIWCNDMFECIDKGSIAEANTYLYISNQEALKQKDEQNMNQEDTEDELTQKQTNSSGGLMRIKSILFCFFFL
jgi:hypothetical protein